MTEPEPPENRKPNSPADKDSASREDSDEGNRTVENMVLAGFFAFLVAAGIWLLGTMADVRKAQDCVAQGRRNCQTIEVPERSR